MRKALALALCACLVVLAGCGTMGTSPSGDQVPVKAAVVAAQWDYYPDFKTLALKMVSAPPRDLTGPVEVGLTTDLDISILGYLTDLASGQELPEAIYPIHDGKTWRLVADFPKVGRYYFTLFGKLKSAAGNTYSALARTVFNVTGDPAGNWVVFPGFQAHAISGVTIPAHDVGDEAKIVLQMGDNLQFGWTFANKTTGNYISNSVEPEYSGQRVTITVSFPESGDYELDLACRPPNASDDAWESVAIARFTATVNAASIGLPAHWTGVNASFRKYGVTLVSSSPADVTDEADIVLSSKQKVSLAYSFSNRTTGKDQRTMGDDVVEIDPPARRRTSLPSPGSRQYELILWAKGEKDKDYSTKLAAVGFNANPTPAPAVPENWVLSPRFKSFGVSLSACSARAVADEATISFTSKEKISLDCTFTNTAGGEDAAALYNLIDVESNGFQPPCPFCFRRGDYTLQLYGKADSSGDNRATIARVGFTATPSPAPKVPGNWTVSPRFKKYGLALQKSSPRAIGDELSIVLAVPDGWQGDASLQGKDGDFVNTVASSVVGREQRIMAVVPGKR